MLTTNNSSMHYPFGLMARAAIRLIGCGATLLLCANVQAAQSDAIVPDRPNFVESSTVVGNNRVLFETGLAVEKDRFDDVRLRTFSTPVLLRFGVSDTVELRLGTDGRQIQRLRDGAAGTTTTGRGFADTLIGMKWHLFDEHGAMPSLATLLLANLDAGSRNFRGHGVRPLVQVTAEWELPAGYSLGIMPGIGVENNDAGGHFTYAQFGVVLGKSFTDKFGGYVEVAAPQIARSRNGGSEVSFDTGLTYRLTDSMQVDTGITRGLNRHTPDFNWTVGFAFRL